MGNNYQKKCVDFIKKRIKQRQKTVKRLILYTKFENYT